MPGTYTFRPIQANLTHDTDWLGKMDPYCSFRNGAQRIKGPICRNGGKFPKWEDATVSIPAVNEPSMIVDLLDKDKILHDDNIGSFVIDLHEVQSVGHLSKWYPIYFNKKPAGEILLEAAFQPDFVQPVLVQQPVVVEKTIIREEIVHKVPTEVHHHHQPEFRDGPVIQGISHIHHGGQGHGLVPNANSTFTQGTGFTQGSTIHQGTHFHQGSALNQGTLHQGSVLNQGTLHQGTALNQGTQYQGIGQTAPIQGSNLGTNLGSNVTGGNLGGNFTQPHNKF